RVVKEGDEAKISINAIQKDGQFRNKLETHVRVVGPDQAVSEVAVHQVGPGAYEAKYPLAKKGSYLFRAVGAESGGSSRGYCLFLSGRIPLLSSEYGTAAVHQQ